MRTRSYQKRDRKNRKKMQLDQMLYERLTTDAGPSALLARYDNRPAVFYQQAAPANDKKWGAKQYPRIDYTIGLQEDPARNTSGILTIHVWCDFENPIDPETIEMQLRKSLHAVFVRAKDDTYCIAWLRSDAWQVRNQKDESLETTCITLTFDLIAFPGQATTTPDPIKALNEWTKALLPQATVIGLDAFYGWIEPSRDRPVVYWRIASQGMHQQKHAMTWMDAMIEGHVYARNAPDRLAVLSRINATASQINHVPMEDGSPLFLYSLTMMPQTNYLRQGQIVARARYGILRDWYANPAPEPKLRNISTTVKGV